MWRGGRADRPKRALGRLSTVVAVVVAAAATGYGASVLFAPGPARAAGGPLSTPGAWAVVSTPDPSRVHSDQLASVSCVSTSFCMAVGGSLGESTQSGLVAEWNGTAWSVLPGPEPTSPPPISLKPTFPASTSDDVLDAVSCPSTAFCMAVGSQGGGQALAEVWNGSEWSITSRPPSTANPVQTAPPPPTPVAAVGSELGPRGKPLKGEPLNGVSCTGPTFCMAVGGTTTKVGGQPAADQWDGSAWSVVATPVPPPSSTQTLEGIDCTSAAFCAAVGLEQDQDQHTLPLIEGWNGTDWSMMTPAGSGTDGLLAGISCWGDSFCMADGYTKTSVVENLVERWDGTAWSTVGTPAVSAPDGGGLLSLSCVGPSLCVATGVDLTKTKNAATGYPRVLAWDGRSWALEPSPDPGPAQNLVALYSVSCVARQSCMAVGDSADNNAGTSTTLAELAPLVSTGYYVASAAGGVFSLGGVPFDGSAGGLTLDKPVVGIATTPDGGGYWLVASDGGIFAFGDARFYGSTGGMALNRPIVAMATTPDGGGYWLVASDGGIFCFGDATFHGSTGSLSLSRPIVGMAATFDGGGYWLVQSNGGVVPFGDASDHGSAAGLALAAPIVGMATSPDGGGYWLVGADGGIFATGDAGFHGSAAAVRLAAPIVGMATTPDGGGYWLVGADGGIFNVGDAAFDGSAAGLSPTSPVVGMAD